MLNTATIINKTFLREKIMDLRDDRVRLQRKIAPLKDMLLWEPQNFTETQKRQLKRYEAKVEHIKAEEKLLHNYLYN